jgi:Lipocalin-like domain
MSNRVGSHSLEADEATGPPHNEEGRMDRRDVLLGATTAAVSLAIPAQGQAQAKALRDRLVGAWSLVDIYDKGKDGSQYYVWGEGVQGLAVYTSGGQFSTQIISANRDKAASKTPRMPVGQSIGYFGTYAVDEPTMTIKFKIDRCSFPAWDGTERVSKIALLTAGELKTEGAIVHDPVNGDIIPKAQFKRVG